MPLSTERDDRIRCCQDILSGSATTKAIPAVQFIFVHVRNDNITDAPHSAESVVLILLADAFYELAATIRFACQ